MLSLSRRREKWRARTLIAAATCALCAAPGVVLAQHEWAQFAGSALRTSRSPVAAPAISTPAWVCHSDAQGRPITFAGQAGVAAGPDHVFVAGSITPAGQGRQHRLFAIDRRSGTVAWAGAVPAPWFDSRSTPALDLAHGAVLAASGASVTAFSISSGAPVWQAALTYPVVDASPLATGGWRTDGLGLANRCFVTEYDGFGDDGRLTCINLDPHRADCNPFQPGEVVWSVVIGASSGNTPAVWNGRVFTSGAGEFGAGAGRVWCFDARATLAPAPLWVRENPAGESFFGGVCLHERAGGADLYCASYAFYGGRDSSNLVKLDAATGAQVWSVACNRTGATPVVLPDGRIVLSGGLGGYGTVPTLQVFRDDGGSAELVWDSAAATWTDANANLAMDAGEYLVLGGWSQQPLVTVAGAPRLYVGALPLAGGGAAACADLYAVDVSKLPFTPGGALPGYLAQHFAGAGSTPAVADSNLYSIGPGGLHAFGAAPPRFDVDGDGLIDVGDLYAWEQNRGQRDVNLDGVVNGADRAALIGELRSGELEDMRAGSGP